jgi:hypothetical protein
MIGAPCQTSTRKVFAAQGKYARGNTVAKAAAAEVATVQGPMLNKPYHGPHAVAEDGVNRIVNMLREGDLFRYGGQDEGSLQVILSRNLLNPQHRVFAGACRAPPEHRLLKQTCTSQSI